MSGLTISEIREALATQIQNYVGEDINVYPYPVGKYTVPAVTVDFPTDDYIDYWVTMTGSGLATVRFTVRVETGGVFKEGVGYELDTYLSAGTGNTNSVIDALFSDSSLGLTGCTSVIRQARVDPASVTAELDVEVTIKKVGANA